MSKTFALPLLLTMVLALAAPAAAFARPDHGGREGQGGWRGGEGRGEARGGGSFGRGFAPGGEGRADRPDRGPQGGDYPPEGRYDGRGPRDGGPPYAEPPPQRRPYNSLREGWREQQDEAREGVRNGELRPLGQIIPSLRSRMPGRMLDTGIEEGPDGRAVYRIRWAARNGRRIDFIVDARTGAVLGTEGQ